MNITFVSNPFGYGAAKMLLFIAKGLQQNGHNVEVLVLGDSGKFDYLAEGVSVVYTKQTNNNPYQKLYRDIKFVYVQTKIFKTDVIVSFLGTPNFVSTIVSRLRGVPSVISERVDPFVEYKDSSTLSKIQKRITNYATGAVFQTTGAAEFYSKRLQKRSIVIPNPIQIPEDISPIDYYTLPREIISLGRLNNKQKRLDITLEAFALFHKIHPEYILRIYGGGRDESYVKGYIDRLNLADSVMLMGVSRDSYRDLSKGGIFLITSDYEGISNSLLEAMAIGLPVVSTDHSPGGARLLITDHQNGLLVPPGDINAIVNALCKYADNVEFVKQCGMNATKVKDRFHPDVIISAWECYLIKVSKL